MRTGLNEVLVARRLQNQSLEYVWGKTVCEMRRKLVTQPNVLHIITQLGAALASNGQAKP